MCISIHICEEKYKKGVNYVVRYRFVDERGPLLFINGSNNCAVNIFVCSIE